MYAAILVVLALLLAAAQPPATPATPPPEPPAPAVKPRQRTGADPVRLFYCTHSAGFRHGVLPETREIVKKLGEDLDWLEVEVSDDITELDAAKLATLDAVMLYTTGRLPLDTRMLTDWVHAGGALIGVHSATDTLADDKIYVEKIGGIFDGHPWNEQVRILIDGDGHYITDALIADGGANDDDSFNPPSSLRIADEIYQFRTLNPGNVVLMHLDPATPKAEPGRAYPLAWTRRAGAGRIFYTALGHRPEVWRDERFVQHVLRGIEWTARRCPACSSPLDAVPIVYGSPLQAMIDRANRGEIILGGCVIRNQTHELRCRKCPPKPDAIDPAQEK